MLVLAGLLLAGLFQTQSFAQTPIINDTVSTAWLKLDLNLEKFYLILNNDFNNVILFSSGDSIEVPAGRNNIRIIWENVSDHSRTVNVKPGETDYSFINLHISRFAKSSYELIESGRNTAITTDLGGEIFIDGKHEGTDYTELLLQPGYHDLRIEHPEYGDLSTRFMVNKFVITEIARFNKNPNPMAFPLHFVPGAAYLRNKQYNKATYTYVALGTLTSLAVVFNNKYETKEDEYDILYEEYLTATTVGNAIEKREKALSKREELKDLNTMLTISFVSILGTYAITTLDGMRKPKEGYRGPSNFVPLIGMSRNPISGSTYPTLVFKAKF